MKHIQTLGGLAVFDGGRPLGGNAKQPRRLAILAVLARAGERGVSRDRLAALLWGDQEEERTRRSLNQALYALRQELGSEDAILGTRDLRREAIREGRRGVELLPIERDGLQGPYVQLQLVRIYLLVGEPDQALDQLEPLLHIPFYLSPEWLRIDPAFDPVRTHPRFERLFAATGDG